MAVFWQAAVVCVLSTAGSETVLLDFYADWCGPCRAMTPVLEQLARRGYPIRKVNIDQHPDLAARFGVRAVPCFVMVVDGREVGREVGQVSLARLEQLCLLGRQQPPTSPASRSTGAAGLLAARTGRQNSTPPSGGHPSGSPRAPTTKDGLPIPVVQLGVPRDPAVQAGSANGSSETVSSPSPNVAVGESLPSDSAAVRFAGGQTPSSESVSSPPNPSASLPSGSVTEQDLLASTVRLRVFHGDSLSHGTGTIIDARQGEALILTCGHLFRENQGAGPIEVELFGPSGVQKTPGRLIAWNEQRDLGLVSIRTPGPVRAARVAPVGYPLKKGLLVFSVGCDHGQDPTVHKTWIVSINRYLGSPNLQVADQPVSGRSGGGLFTQEGYLIGVCNAADPADREGLFSSLPAIHAQLDESRLQFVYQQPPDLPPQMPRPNSSGLAAHTLPPSAPLGSAGASENVSSSSSGGRASGDLAALPGIPSRLANQDRSSGSGFQRSEGGRNPSESFGPVGGASAGTPSVGGPLVELAAAVRSGPGLPASPSEEPRLPNRTAPAAGEASAANPPAVSLPTGGGENEGRLVSVETTPREVGGRRPEESAQAGRLRAEESALLEEIARRRGQGAEVIFIVRPTDNPQAKSEIFVLNQASPELLARLGAAARRSEIRETSLVVGPERKGTGSLEPSDLRPAGQPIPDPSQRRPFSLPPLVPSSQ